MPRFLSIGECMVEIAPAGDDLHRIGFAGDTFNTAWYARRVLPPDWEVDYFTAVGTDAVSDEMLGFMAGEGVGTDSIRRLPDRTVGLYMISLKHGERSFAYWRGQSAAKLMADDGEVLSEALAGRDVIHFSGITMAILDVPGRERLCNALRRARRAGALVSFDTNLRPRLWKNEDEMREGLLLGASVANVVLPSFDEETQLFGDRSPLETITRYSEGGAEIIAVKNGGAPGLIWTQDGTAADFAPPRVEEVVDSTAAGDSFAAAFLAGIATGETAPKSAATASELAARVIGERGALAPQLFEGREAKWTY